MNGSPNPLKKEGRVYIINGEKEPFGANLLEPA
jgi:hypothetical protein